MMTMIMTITAHFQAPTHDRFVHQKLGPILTMLHVLNICTSYYHSRRYFSYIVRCPSSYYWLYATLISSLMMMITCYESSSAVYDDASAKETFKSE